MVVGRKRNWEKHPCGDKYRINNIIIKYKYGIFFHKSVDESQNFFLFCFLARSLFSITIKLNWNKCTYNHLCVCVCDGCIFSNLSFCIFFFISEYEYNQSKFHQGKRLLLYTHFFSIFIDERTGKKTRKYKLKKTRTHTDNKID